MKKFAFLLLSLTAVVPAPAQSLDCNAMKSGSDRIVFEYAKDICPNALKFTAVSDISKGMNFIKDEARRARFTPEQQQLLIYMCGIYAVGYHDSSQRVSH